MAVYESSYGKDMRTLSFNIFDFEKIAQEYSGVGVGSYNENYFNLEYGDVESGDSINITGEFDYFVGDGPGEDGVYYQIDSFSGIVNSFNRGWHYHEYEDNQEQYFAGSYEISGIALDYTYFTGKYTDAEVAARIFQGSDDINGSIGNDYLLGYSGNDTLRGDKAHDTLDGGRGGDRMLGGAGNDIFFVDNRLDIVVEYARQGTDLVNASISYRLGSQVENLTLTGTKSVDGVGNELANVITGNSGKNTLKGGDGKDTLKGRGNNDVLDGGAGNDKLYGGTGRDALKGGSGKDMLKGESGNDTLYGGAGADKLYGGSGKDTFVFKSTKDSGVSSSARDTIYDFSRKQGDRIDLKAIDADKTAGGNQAFTFIGSEKFNEKAGELRYQKNGGDTFVLGDVNGDGKSDFAIKVDASLNLTKADFLL